VMTERSSLLDPDLIIYRCDFVHLECDGIQLYWLTVASGGTLSIKSLF